MIGRMVRCTNVNQVVNKNRKGGGSRLSKEAETFLLDKISEGGSMQKRKFCVSLAVLAVTLAMMTVSSVSADSGKTPLMGGMSKIQMTMTANIGGTVPADIVAGQTNLQVQSNMVNDKILATTIAANQKIQPATVNAAKLNSVIAQDASAASSGGNYFHAGKYFVASTPIETAGCMTAIAI